MVFRLLLLLVVLASSGCREEVQVHESLGAFQTRPDAETVAEFRLVDSGRWPLYELATYDSSPWPVPFVAELRTEEGSIVASREVTELPSNTQVTSDGLRKLRWTLDERGNEDGQLALDEDGLFPIDRLMTDGEPYRLRLILPPSPAADYSVILLEMRELYPWQHDS